MHTNLFEECGDCMRTEDPCAHCKWHNANWEEEHGTRAPYPCMHPQSNNTGFWEGDECPGFETAFPCEMEQCLYYDEKWGCLSAPVCQAARDHMQLLNDSLKEDGGDDRCRLWYVSASTAPLH
jgi:hypothetical protein